MATSKGVQKCLARSVAAMLVGIAGVALIMVWRNSVGTRFIFRALTGSRTDPRRRCARCGVRLAKPITVLTSFGAISRQG